LNLSPADNSSENEEMLLRHFHDPEQLNISSLVLSSASLPHRVVITGQHNFSLYLQHRWQEEAEYQLAAYEEESRHWPPPKPVNLSVNFQPLFRAMTPTLITALALFYLKSGDWDSGSIWFTAGAGDANKILDGQWYRLVTALTLHADALHLLSNLAIGAIFLHYFFAITGSGFGLAAILFTGTLANLFNVLTHGGNHLFVGFSTALFAVAGMLCTIGLSRPKEEGESWRHRLVRLLLPLMGGLSLLAMLGSSGEHTDLGGHLFGLLTGLAVGNVVHLHGFDHWRRSAFLQTLFAAASLFTLILCWRMAFSIR